jgi:7,8-dihydropterin-6-yl-methyl-4-(beta-D-ribofuranosyl)aminobenzene 5'-phosphate synthase
MKIQLLCENEASDMVWLAEWGFSAFIEFDGSRILFDTGYSDVWWRNALHAGIDLDSVNVLALSHFHRDHTRGLRFHRFRDRKKLILHPRITTAALKTDKQAVKDDFAEIHRILAADFDLIPSRQALEFLPGAFFLGEIPRITTFEPGCFEDDPMEDDTALAFRTEKGAVVVSGCSHAGICNICEYAKQITGQKLYAVLGGFHLLARENPPVEETISYFRGEAPEVLLPMHCVDFSAQARFHAEFGSPKYGAGSIITL